MVEVVKNYPVAVTASSAADRNSVKAAVVWILQRAEEQDGQVLVYSPGRQNAGYDPVLSRLSQTSGVASETWQTLRRTRWRGGPVLAAWPDQKHLAEIAEDRRTSALCVVPWLEKDVDAWVRARSPQQLGGLATAASEKPLVSNPVVVQGLRTLSHSVNHANALAGSMDRRDAIAVLQTLDDGRYPLVAEDIYAWALANGWSASGADRLKELAARISAGHRPRLNGPNPFRRDILDVWKVEAAHEDS